MEVQMGHSLAAVLAAVVDNAVAVVGEAQLACDFGDNLVNTRHVVGIFGGYVIHRRDVLLGNDDNVERRLGVDVVEGINQVILVDLL